MNILYVLSTLKSSGPVNQLFNVVKGLPDEYKINILTLSPEPSVSRLRDFESLGCVVNSLNLGRIEGLFYAKRKLRSMIEIMSPDIIHSQGFRADKLVSGFDFRSKWISTAHNYPWEDYPMKFGRIKGSLMARSHLNALGKCENLISCSFSIREQLESHNILSTAIKNGVNFQKKYRKGKSAKLNIKKFITVGSLIPRKNNIFLINSFNEIDSVELTVLGDGPQYETLVSISDDNKNIQCIGFKSNVHHYLELADFFISSSLSEGLPNTVLEALSLGLPCILSDIPSHREIYEALPKSVLLFDTKNKDSLINLINNDLGDNSLLRGQELIDKAREIFSSDVMSNKYNEFYLKVING